MFPAACLISWLFGIFLSGYLGSNILVFILPVFLAGLWLAGAFLFSRINKQKFSRQSIPLKVFMILLFSLFSALLYETYVTSHFEKAVSLCQSNPTSLTGVVSGEVSRYNDTDYCTVTLEGGEKVLVKIRTEQPLLPGEKITLEEPTLSVVQPANRQSAQMRRMLGNGTFLSATFPYEATLTRHGVQNFWLYGSKMLRNLAKEHFAEHYPAKTASFLTALLSSDKSMMAKDLYQEFLDTGTVHIVVVSGMHFSLLASALLFVLGVICRGRRKRLLITLPLLVVFAWFTGGTLPVMRSLLMSSLLFCYDLFYIRPVKSYVTVLAVACLFVAVTPTLIFHPSFLLTFGATFGIAAFYEPLRTRFRWIPTQYLRNSLAMYVAVQPFTLPVILLYFSRMPLGAIVANFLVAPLVAPILILAVVGLAVANLPLLGPLILWVETALTKLFLWLIHCSEGICCPLSVSLGEFPFLLWMGSGILLFFCRTNQNIKRIFARCLAGLLMMIAFVHTAFPLPQNQLTLTFLGAKNTNSCVITTPADRLILYGSLQDIAYGRGSSYDEHASVALVILTDLPDSEETEALLKELPCAQIICPARYGHLLTTHSNTILLRQNLATRADGIQLRLFADENTLYEAEFSYQEHQFSFSQNADYILKNSHKNPDKLWIANFKRSGNATDNLTKIPGDFRLLSKKIWHPDTKLYDNYSMLIFSQKDTTFYGTKEQKLLWN